MIYIVVQIVFYAQNLFLTDLGSSKSSIVFFFQNKEHFNSDAKNDPSQNRGINSIIKRVIKKNIA